MRIEKSLNPNCSEAVVRFLHYAGFVDTASLDALKDFADIVRKEIKRYKEEWKYKISEAKAEPLVCYDNIGGGASPETLARIIYAVIEEVYKGKKFDLDKLWDEEKGKGVKIVYGGEY